MEQAQELLQKWKSRTAAGLVHPRMEIAEGGLTLGAGTVLAKMGRDERGRPRLALDGERALALLAIAYEGRIEAYGLAKLQRAAALWNEGEKALAHIHLAHIGLPPCDETMVLRLFIADALLAAGASPQSLIEAQDSLAKFNVDQLRVPQGNGRESGRWTRGAGGATPVAFRSRREKGGRRKGSGGFHAIHEFLDWLRGRTETDKDEPAFETKRPTEETASQIKPFGTIEADLPRPGYGKEVSIPGLPENVRATDSTNPYATMPNYKTDLTRSEFESILSKLGWTREDRPKGIVENYRKDGARYSIRDDAKSTGGPTADFYHPRGDGTIDMKLRLGKNR